MPGPTILYQNDFDKAALDTHSPWLPQQPPVADKEASETRGGAVEIHIVGFDKEGYQTGSVVNTLTERDKNYGDFTDNADYAQRIKQVFYESKNWRRMPTYMQEALDLIASKFGRLLSGDPFHKDGWHDIQGYAELVEQRINTRSK
jgi:hypothetical protein